MTDFASMMSDLQACDNTQGKCPVSEKEDIYCDPQTGECYPKHDEK